MPQLDFSFYISQITWLLVSFFGFFCISKFLILPRLDKILKNRADFIKLNVDFAKEKLDEAEKINKICDEKIIKLKQNIENEKISLIKNLTSRNSKKINDLKKRLLESENENVIKIKKDLENISQSLDNEIRDIVVAIIAKIYHVNITTNNNKNINDISL